MTSQLRIEPNEATVLAADVGGTTIKSALVRAGVAEVSVERSVTPHGPGAADRILDFLDARLAEAESLGAVPDAIGLAVPGIVDEARGLAVKSVNLGWSDVPFAQLLRQRYDRPVWFGHDVRAAGRAEVEIGAARGIENALIITLGTGIAATIVSQGNIISAGGYAGEIGQAVVRSDSGWATLESVASASAVARRYRQLSGKEAAGSREVFERAQSHADPIAERVISDMVRALAEALGFSITVLAPELIVLGGGLSRAEDALLDPLRDWLIPFVKLGNVPPIVTATLGEDAGIIGTIRAAQRAAEDARLSAQVERAG